MTIAVLASATPGGVRSPVRALQVAALVSAVLAVGVAVSCAIREGPIVGMIPVQEPLIGAGVPWLRSSEILRREAHAHGVVTDFVACNNQEAIGLLAAGLADYVCLDSPATGWPGGRGVPGEDLVQIPVAGWMLSLRHNVPGMGDHLRLSAAVIRATYTGEIRRWSDPMVAADNPNRGLPDCQVVPYCVVEARGADSMWHQQSLLLARYLHGRDPQLAQGLASGPALLWPAARFWSDELSGDPVAETLGALYPGRWPQLPPEAQVIDATGSGVSPSVSSGMAALRALALQSVADGPLAAAVSLEEPAYPIVHLTHLVFYRDSAQRPPHVSRRLATLARYLLGSGQQIMRACVAERGCFPLPDAMTRASLDAVGRWEDRPER